MYIDIFELGIKSVSAKDINLKREPETSTSVTLPFTYSSSGIFTGNLILINRMHACAYCFKSRREITRDMPLLGK